MLLFILLLLLTPPILPAALAAIPSKNSIGTAQSLINQAKSHLANDRDPEAALQVLAQVYGINSNTPGLMSCLEDAFRLKIDLNCDVKYDRKKSAIIASDRLGLASLLVDQERHEEATRQLQLLLQLVNACSDDELRDNPNLELMQDKAASMLFRAEAAICHWDDYDRDAASLMTSLRKYLDGDCGVPPVHAFEALKWACIDLEDATQVASLYGKRALRNVYGPDVLIDVPAALLQTKVDASSSSSSIIPFVKASYLSQQQQQQQTQEQYSRSKRIKVGYLSPDFTGSHPLAFLMQDVFRLHNDAEFDVCIYSMLENNDDSLEVSKIRNSANKWTVFPAGASADEISSKIVEDDLDILIDLCGYTGTMTVAEVMAHRVAPVQISYMGFPGSSGAPYVDYLICDQVVVPPSVSLIRKHYSERLITMPHCYFVNSHKYVAPQARSNAQTRMSRADYSLPENGFVFCCHSRPDKIDPNTFRDWLFVLADVKIQGRANQSARQADAVLWLLASGTEMEANLRKIAKDEFGLSDDALVFANVAPRLEHLQRLSLADLFLDTPSYNAHTVGCDALYAGVPMVSLLRPDDNCHYNDSFSIQSVPTEKLASRVGASLLKAANIEEMVAPSMHDYRKLMHRCVNDFAWFSGVKEQLLSTKDSCPLFDTVRWVRNLEVGLKEVMMQRLEQSSSPHNIRDIYIEDIQEINLAE